MFFSTYGGNTPLAEGIIVGIVVGFIAAIIEYFKKK